MSTEKPPIWIEHEEGGLPFSVRLSLSIVVLTAAVIAIAAVLR